jgi:general secretion pathway protein A
MILDYYNLREEPFGVTADPGYLYLSPTHREALASLSYGIQSGRGFMSLLAKPGMGKTTILFQLLDQLKGSTRTVYLFQTLCRSEDLLCGLLRDLGVVDDSGDVVHMQQQLNRVLLAEAHQGRKVVLVIDEAQNLEESALELVRMLSNFETTTDKLMQIILAGQPQLRHKLASPQLLQLRQRISIFARLSPFDAEDTHSYIEHRLRVAGYNFQTPLFTPQAEALIAKHSAGIPRNINNICFNALSLGWVLKQKSIEKEVVGEVLDDLDLEAEESAGRALIGWKAIKRGKIFQQTWMWRKRLALFAMLLLPLVWVTDDWRGRPALAAHSSPSVKAATPALEQLAEPVQPPAVSSQVGPKQEPPALPMDVENSTTAAPHTKHQSETGPVAKPTVQETSGGRQAISPVVSQKSLSRPHLTQTSDLSTLWAQVKKNNSDAEIKLALMYIEGAVVPQNCEQAKILLLAASRKGNSQAINLLNDHAVQCHWRE